MSPRNADAFGAGGAARRAAEGGRSADVTRAVSPGGHAIEIWRVDGLAHALGRAGDASGSHADPAGPDASAHMLRFFREIGRG